MKGMHLIYTDLKRAVFSWRFLCSVLGVTIALFMGAAGLLRQPSVSGSIWGLLECSWSSGFIMMILCVLPVFGFGLSYAAEWEEKAERYWMIRSGASWYALSKIWNAAFSGFLIVFLGITLFILALLPLYPLYTSAASGGLYGEMIADGRVLTGLFLYITHYSLSGSIAAVCSLWFSSLLPNPFAAAAAPLVAYNVFLRVLGISSFPAFLPEYLAPGYWMNAVYYADTAGGSIGIKIGITLGLCVIMGFFAKRNMKRRLCNE